MSHLNRIILDGCTLFALLTHQAARSESVTEYAETCNQAVGVAVSEFDCTAAHEIPMVAKGKGCEKPPYLPSASCRKGSRLWVQATNNPNVAVIGLCRKKGDLDPDNPLFDDIAVIQTNFETGATCFYQKLDKKGINGSKVPAPSSNTGNFWYTPKEVRDQKCASCHDTGLIRTPYLMQVKVGDKSIMPNKRHKDSYWFPGEVLGEWNGKVSRIKDKALEKSCTSCHAMGANMIWPDFGTSTWLGLRSTGVEQTASLEPPYAHWMKPGRNKPNAQDKKDAQRMATCALGRGTDCSVEPWGGQVQAIIDSLHNRKLPELMEPASLP